MSLIFMSGGNGDTISIVKIKMFVNSLTPYLITGAQKLQTAFINKEYILWKRTAWESASAWLFIKLRILRPSLHFA